MFIPDRYLELLHHFLPRPIDSEEKLEAMQEVVNSLLDKPQLTSEEQEYLNVLGSLISEYEQTQEPIPDIYGVELLKVLLEERGLRQKDLVPIFKTESIISDILKGKRELTVRHIQELANFFHLSPTVFFPRRPENNAG
jgi:HTH-type transcriptional regulator/antitoxin HigA